jgi:hypothetical protein
MMGLWGLWRPCVAGFAVVATAGVARADYIESSFGRGVGLGPVFAVGGGDSNGARSIGWELSGILDDLYKRASVGGSYVVSREGEGPPSYHYATFEPWLIVGATLGVAVTNEPRVKVAYGVWEGIGVPLSAFDISEDARWDWMVSVCGGLRMIGSDVHFYFTPKLWLLRGYDPLPDG